MKLNAKCNQQQVKYVDFFTKINYSFCHLVNVQNIAPLPKLLFGSQLLFFDEVHQGYSAGF